MHHTNTYIQGIYSFCFNQIVIEFKMLPILIKKETPFFNQIDLEFRNVYTTPFFNLIAEKQ